ncbi:MAG: glycosyltransferase [Alphaproteobacteria bacterium]|nr:glycosyltransferase [Alphaproteobacteria bacterium]
MSTELKNEENLYSKILKILKNRYDIEISDKPDFLFFSCFGAENLKYYDCVKIFITGENVLPNFNLCDYACAFDDISFGDRYFRKRYYFPEKAIQDRSFITPDMANRKFCNFIYSNSNNGEGSILRQEFCKKLMEYKHVDCPGKILNNMSADDLEPRNGDWINSKIKFLNKYKFTIAFENSSSNGYTTEKLYHPILAGSVPIYWGNPDVLRDFNPKAFINANDFNNDFDAIVEYVKELDSNDEKYLAMLQESPMREDFDFDQDKKFAQWIYHIIEKGNKPFVKDPLNFDMSRRLKIDLDLSYEQIKNKQKYSSFKKRLFSIDKTSKKNKIIVRFLGLKLSLKKKHA